MRIFCVCRTSWREQKIASPWSAAATMRRCRITTRSLHSSRTVWWRAWAGSRTTTLTSKRKKARGRFPKLVSELPTRQRRRLRNRNKRLQSPEVFVSGKPRISRYPELLADSCDDLLRGFRGVDHDGIDRFLKIGELAGQDAFASKMAVALANSFGEECVTPFQINNFNFGAGTKLIAIGALEGGARKHDVFANSDPFEDGFAHGCEPRSAIGVIKWDSVGHFFDVGGRMEAVGVGELPVELRGEHGAHSGLAGTGCA